MPLVEVDISAVPGSVDGGDPLVLGTVRLADGTVTPFQGWVGLLALLQQALPEPAADGTGVV